MASDIYPALLDGGGGGAHGQLPAPPRTGSGDFISGMDVPVDVDSWNAEKVSDWLVSADLEKFASVGIPHPCVHEGRLSLLYARTTVRNTVPSAPQGVHGPPNREPPEPRVPPQDSRSVPHNLTMSTQVRRCPCRSVFSDSGIDGYCLVRMTEVDLEQELQIKSNLERVKVFRAIKVLRTASSSFSDLSSGRTSTSQSEVMSQSQLLSHSESEAATATAGFMHRRGGVVQVET